jgi:PAS domain S-box-containing protein
MVPSESQINQPGDAGQPDTSDQSERIGRRLFEQIASTTPDFLYAFDLSGRFTYANQSLLKVWGTTLEGALGKSLIELGYPQWHADMHMREIRQVIETKQPIKGEVPFTGGSGISGIYEYIFTPVLGPDGEVEVIAGTTRDVAERRAAEQQKARDAMLLSNVQDAVIVCDLHGLITFWNQGATQLFGWTAAEMLNRPYADRFPESSRGEVNAWVKTIADSGVESTGEWLDYRKDGSRIWIEGTARRITDATMPPCLMGVCRDISGRKKVEVERDNLLASERVARSEAERASRMKDEFLATLSHELRTPLNAILGWATILASAKPDEKDLRDGLDAIQRNARAQTQIIEDLLDMSRIISGKVRFEVQPTDLNAVLYAAIETVAPAIVAKDLKLVTQMDAPVKPINADPARLQQVFWNLLHNAVKFTPRGGQIQVQMEQVDSHVKVNVHDTGEGIKPEFLPHVFERFRQADGSTTRRHGGLGLGLAIVKQLVELHGGTVKVKSAGQGQGSTFTVTMPMTATDVQTPAGQSTADGSGLAVLPSRASVAVPGNVQPLVDESLNLNGLRVLVVDDEPDARAMVKRLLEDRGVITTVADSVQQALLAIATDPPDVVISDIGMPGEDGFALIRQLRSMKTAGAVPAVALTAFARTEDRVRVMRAGFQSHVVKPVDAAELLTVIGVLARRIGQ